VKPEEKKRNGKSRRGTVVDGRGENGEWAIEWPKHASYFTEDCGGGVNVGTKKREQQEGSLTRKLPITGSKGQREALASLKGAE